MTVSCTAGPKETGRLGVAVTILPQIEFVESVGGEKVDVTVMVPPGASPHAYEPKPSQLAALAEAEMYARVGSGIDFELVWMDKLAAANKEMLVVDCSAGIELQAMTEANEDRGLDPHIWMSPPNAAVMVRNICKGLIQVDPDNRTYYEQNRDAYLNELTQLDRDIHESLSGMQNRLFMVYHPALGYFAREYGLTMLPIEEEGKEPSPADLARLIEQAKEHNIKVIFVEPQFNPQSAEVIADAIDGKVISIDPLTRDYLANVRHLTGELIKAME